VIGFLLGLWIGIALLLAALPARSAESDPLLDAVNEVRADHHLRLLAPRLELAEVAQAHADDMARRNYLSHVNPEGRNPLDRAQAAGVEGFRLLAENIGATSVRGDPHRAVLEEWLRSPEHHENLVHPAFNATGLGIAITTDGTTIYVQLYAAY
jgi:uncharacterized protein YkwD